jgi:uncharacterized protein (TIGR01244 family)
MIRTIDDTISVAPQITAEDVPAIAAAGFVAIVNNRPNDEEHGQPDAAAIARAAEAEGLNYIAIPVTMGNFSSQHVEAMADVLATAGGPVLAFCRSGTRSCNLWALAQASMGGDPAGLTAKAAGAGYDLSGIRPALDQLSGAA